MTRLTDIPAGYKSSPLGPIPEDWECVSDIVELGKSLIKGLESLSKADKNIREFGFDSVIERDLAVD